MRLVYGRPLFSPDCVCPSGGLLSRDSTSYFNTHPEGVQKGDERYRLCQEMVLGIGGVAMLRALGYARMRAYHVNEGHPALLGPALLAERTSNRGPGGASHEDVESVRRSCVFTTHTPVRSGHDQFPTELAAHVMGRERLAALLATNGLSPDALSMTQLALSLSRYVNGVAMSHRETAGHL